METRVLITQIAYLLSAVLFILGLKRLSHPDTARRGNQLAAFGMLLAVVATLYGENIVTWQWIVSGLILGSVLGGLMARLVKMTAMPQMVGLFNGFGGLASGLVAAAEYLRYTQGVADVHLLPLDGSISIMAGTLIGAVTFSGSLVAFGKLQGIVTEKSVRYPLQKPINAVLFAGILAAIVYLIVSTPGLLDAGADTPVVLYLVLWAAAMLLGVLLVIPIGGADMPVVVSLLNSYSGLAASAAGFVLSNNALIISGALVGASGLILTRIMCKAMNRSLANVIFGTFGQTAGAVATGEKRTMADVNSVQADDVAMLMAYAKHVVIVPGYGLAVAQAQHKLAELCDQLQKRGVTVKYAVHPVAGRMPGHMNVLLAEANVPYTQLYEIEDVNPDIANVDVALVVGANDVVNPAARDEPSSDLYGMPIIEVDRAKHAVVMKRSLNPGFAGVDNELFYLRNTMMLFGDAGDSIGRILEEVKQL
ncbi:MAG: NAD(P)(+) transhydrogenase (Re/Si-specific) subunit beta [Gemmatimonadota bacterium]|nr:NAD(P)(+) transhydrogenase (Re/Si-specific) subunit beta [Gemmatimonadota bacterium]